MWASATRVSGLTPHRRTTHLLAHNSRGATLKFVFVSALVACALACSSAAHAEDFSFYFGGYPLGHDDIFETISGTLFGLASDGYSSPTSIDVFSDEAGDRPWFPASGGFTVSDDKITFADFSAGSHDPGCFSGCSLSFNSTDQLSHAGYGHGNQLYVSGDLSIDHFQAINPVSPAPEPSTWLLLIAGVGMVGTMLRTRARKTFGRALA